MMRTVFFHGCFPYKRFRALSSRRRASSSCTTACACPGFGVEILVVGLGQLHAGGQSLAELAARVGEDALRQGGHASPCSFPAPGRRRNRSGPGPAASFRPSATCFFRFCVFSSSSRAWATRAGRDSGREDRQRQVQSQDGRRVPVAALAEEIEAVAHGRPAQAEKSRHRGQVFRLLALEQHGHGALLGLHDPEVDVARKLEALRRRQLGIHGGQERGQRIAEHDRAVQIDAHLQLEQPVGRLDLPLGRGQGVLQVADRQLQLVDGGRPR